MAAAEVGLKSPSIPLFERGNYLGRALTPLWKRGEGEILGAQWDGNICGELLGQDTRNMELKESSYGIRKQICSS